MTAEGTVTDAQRRPERPERAFDPTDPAFRRHPYPRYAELREDPDLHRTPDGLWVLTRYDDVLAVVRDARLSSHPRHSPDRRRGGENAPDIPLIGDGTIEIMLTADAPDHTRLRRLANKAFTPRAVEALRPRIAEIVGGMLDRAAEQGSMDVMHDIAEPLPVLVICDLMGVPVEDQAQFKPWSETIARMLDPDVNEETLQQAIPAVMGFVGYFGQLMEERRKAPGSDLLSALIAAEEEGDKLTHGELFAMIILLFIAGHETTTNLLGNGTLALLRNPDQLAALRADPQGLAVPATEELLRYDSPVQVTVRTATTDLEVNGIALAKGESVLCGLAAGNRDPRYVEAPEELHLERGRPSHLSFSNGMHYCLGAPLARLEGQIAFSAMATRFAAMELETDDPPYRDHFVLRGLASLPVRVSGR
ncbi:MAG TPA: cytochrome P450 [Acidimicrobiales bacterium]|nr:cytochrome P450 [Acidimicrobiales bacterium]